MKGVTRIGVVTGVAHELDALLPDEPRVALGDGRPSVSRVDWRGKSLFLACAGIGKVAAATAATVLAARHDVELLLVIGTAGKIGFAEGDLFLLTDLEGNVPVGSPDGFGLYFQDTRYLSGYELGIQGLRPTVLLSTGRSHFLGAQVLTNPNLVTSDGTAVAVGAGVGEADGAGVGLADGVGPPAIEVGSWR